MTNQRKAQHLQVVLSGKAHPNVLTTGFENIRFEHVALPEIDMDEIDLSSRFLNRQIKLPFLVSSMTGGPVEAETINHRLALACETLRIPFAIGSQRVALENETDGQGGLSHQIRSLAPSVPLLGNIGAAQLAKENGLDHAMRAVEMIEADALIIHLNPMQEAVQPEGDRNWKGIANAIERLCKQLPVPVIAKEVGYGISPTVAKRLLSLGVSIIDVAGAGGTSWSQVEAHRSPTVKRTRIADPFKEWGQPTALALARLHDTHPGLCLIASGGFQSGLDAAKAIRLGAKLVGQAAAVLPAAIESTEAVIEHFTIMAEQLRIACFCTGSRTLAELANARLEQPLP